MTATPADIAKYTSDGVVLTKESIPVRDAHPDARDGGEVEMFFNASAHAQLLLDERFAILSNTNPLHEGVEVSESLGLGTTVPLAPTVPCFRAIDAGRGIDKVVRTRAYVYEAGSDKYSVEVVE